MSLDHNYSTLIQLLFESLAYFRAWFFRVVLYAVLNSNFEADFQLSNILFLNFLARNIIYRFQTHTQLQQVQLNKLYTSLHIKKVNFLQTGRVGELTFWVKDNIAKSKLSQRRMTTVKFGIPGNAELNVRESGNLELSLNRLWLLQFVRKVVQIFLPPLIIPYTTQNLCMGVWFLPIVL